jgi:hypothetical protein
MRKIPKGFFVTLFAIQLFFSAAYSQSLIWAKHYLAGSNPDQGEDVHLGGDGRIYVAGYLGSTQFDAMLISYTSGGAQNWVASYAGTAASGDNFRAVTSTGTGSSIAIYAAGFATNTSAGKDMLLVKYNQSGTQQWAATWHNSPDDQANCIATDGSGNIYVCGRSYNGINGDLFVRKYNSSGTLQWGMTYNSSGNQDDAPQFMKIADPYIYITSIRKISSTDHDAVLQKIDQSNGSIVWTSVYDGGLTDDIDETYSIDLFSNRMGTSIYTVGKTQTASNGADALLLEYNASGTLVCTSTWNSSYNLDDVLGSIDVYAPLDVPEIYVTGYTQVNTANNDADYLTMKFGCSGPTWVSTYDGAGSGCPTANDDYAYQLMVSPGTGYVYVTGRTYEPNVSLNATTVKYDPDTGSKLWAATYDRNSNDNTPLGKYPLELEYDACHNSDYIYVTGYSRESTGDRDATTLKYGLTGACANRLAAPGTNGTNGTNGAGLVYPNPFSNSAVFKCNSEEIVNASFMIYDLTGREVKRMDNISVNEFEIDSKDMTAGIYFYRFMQEEEIISSGKFVIEK